MDISIQYILKTTKQVRSEKSQTGYKKAVMYIAFYIDKRISGEMSTLHNNGNVVRFNKQEYWTPSDFKALKLPHSTVLA